MKPFNPAQAKLLANFSADLAKGLLLAGISVQFLSKELFIYKSVLMFLNSGMAIILLMFAVDILRGVKE
ncbi:hypothetical protein HZB97_01850 [Candidatus Gottesmanbacteria bacterium]|nr:hypothetical protein [Candidatus Gottesmanbacteria bacterium]